MSITNFTIKNIIGVNEIIDKYLQKIPFLKEFRVLKAEYILKETGENELIYIFSIDLVRFEFIFKENFNYYENQFGSEVYFGANGEEIFNYFKWGNEKRIDFFNINDDILENIFSILKDGRYKNVQYYLFKQFLKNIIIYSLKCVENFR